MPALSIEIEAKFAKVYDELDKLNARTAASAKHMEDSFKHVKEVFKEIIAVAGVSFGVEAFKGLIENSISAAAHLHELSIQTGLSVETLSGLKLIAKEAGTDIDSVGSLVNKLEKNMKTFADNGVGPASVGFRQLGFSQADVKAGLQDMNKFLPEFAKRLIETGVGGEQAGLAMQLLNKGGAAALPVLEALAESGGLVAKTTKEQADEAHKLEVALAKLSVESDAFKQKIVFTLVPALTRMGQAFLDARKNGEGFFKALGAAVAGAFDTGLKGTLDGLSQDLSAEASRLVKLHEILDDANATDKEGNKTGRYLGKGALEKLKKDVELSEKKVSTLKAQIANVEGLITDNTPAEESHDNKPLKKVKTDAQIAEEQAAARAALAARLGLAQEEAKVLLDQAKAGADGQLAILDKQHALGLVSEGAYWDARAGIQKTALAAEIDAIDAQVLEIEKADLNPPVSKTPEADRLKRERDLLAALALRDTKTDQFAQREKLDNIEREKAGADYLLQLEKINIQVLELSGHTDEAADAAQRLQIRDLRKSLGNDPASDGVVDQLDKAGKARLELNRATTETQRILENLGITQQRIDLAGQTGALSELGVMHEKSVANQDVLDSLQEQYDIIKKLATLNPGNKDLEIQANRLKLTMEQLAAETDLTATRIKGVLSDAFSDEFTKILDGTESVSEGFRNMAKSITASINKLIAQDIGNALYKSITGGGKGGGAGGLGGLFGGGGAGGGLGDLFGFFTGGYSSLNVGSFGDFAFPMPAAMGGVMTSGGMLPLRRYASGGVATSPQYSMFGEGSRPEAYVPLPDGRSIPVSMRGGGNGGGGNVTVHMNVTTPDAGSFRQSKGQILGDLNRAVRDSSRRYRY